MANDHYEFLIIGTGAGGGTLAHELARAGKRVLILERGPFLPREKENWETKAVFVENRYHTKEVWSDKRGKPIHPGTGYWVGGNTKVYGAALFRLRREDFGVLQHKDGISPAWPLTYEEFEPYYTRAEKLYCVRGLAGIDPTEPPRSEPLPFPPLVNEPRMQAIEDSVRHLGLHPFAVPLGLKRNDADAVKSLCIRCDTCDGFPCLVQAKSDAEMNCIRPVMDLGNVRLITEAKVLKILTSPSGREASGVETELKDGSTRKFTADIVVVACGAINSAALLLASASCTHPNGLANSSDQVGRNFMFHNSSALLAISTKLNPSKYMKTFGINDFYFGEKDYPYPMGSVQPVGSFKWEMLKEDAPPFTPPFILKMMKNRAVPWWLMTEDLPDPNNRVRWIDGKVRLEYTKNNQESFHRLIKRWTQILRQTGHGGGFFNLNAYFKKYIDIAGVGHQNGTCRFGKDPKQSVLDLNCKAHDLDNLYVVDSSFFPSCGAVNPSLTIIANAMRVADHLIKRVS